MLFVSDGMVWDQSRSMRQPKNMFSHPAGTMAAIWSVLTSLIAMIAMASEHRAMITNWATSVRTTLIIPPRRTYTAVMAMMIMP